MMPAVEEIPETPLPAAEQKAPITEAAMKPAKSRGSSQALERMRDRMRGIHVEHSQWVHAADMPLDGYPVNQASTQPVQTTQSPQSHMMARGTALSTLMRSATKQYAPTPMLTAPVTRAASQIVQATNQPQMRGALRQVVRNAQHACPCNDR